MCKAKKKRLAEKSSTARVGTEKGERYPLFHVSGKHRNCHQWAVLTLGDACMGAFRLLCNINFQQRLAVCFLTGAWLQQPLSVSFPKGIPGLSASCSAWPDPSAQGKSWWSTGLQQNDVPACSSAGMSRAKVVSALTNVVSIFVRPISAARGIWLLVSIWLDRLQVFFHVINKMRWELEIFEQVMLTIAALRLSQCYKNNTNLEAS